MFAKLCKAQCFPDGNKRTNLIFANALCLKFNYKIIRIINHVSFARKLVDYYNDDINLDKFIRYVNETSNLDFKEYKQSVTVGQTIQSLMEYYGINESELARIIGVDRSYVNRIISGERKPSIKIAKAIAEALHIK
jgi:antitoxin component HigA of HigAB toxin-antitoxin module